MSEFSDHWRLGPSNPHLYISDTTAQAFSPDTNTLNNTLAVRRAKLVEGNPNLVDALEELIDGWHLDDDLIEYFEEGFTFGHALVAYEAEVSGTKLPRVEPDTIKNFMAGLQIDWETGADYARQRFSESKGHNGKYLDALLADTSNDRLLSAHQSFAFILGGFNAHDLLWQQKFVDSVIEGYKRNAHETAAMLE